ncbi:Lysosomal Pro-X carboxypeptidase [Halotydeus destructor]|nr:Lysosomal Pro-X carboxypeptidase [Halotydeus destructor]
MSQLAVLILFSSLISGHYGSLAAHNRLRTSVGQPIPANITVSWYKQKVDHFSVANNDYFQQKVITSTDHWGGEGSPIFFYAGNEGGIFEFANNTGFMWERAAEFKAMVVFVEHRYYGESMPYGNDSYKSLDKLGYLSSEQALADYATFIQDLKLTTKGAARSPVIVFGGSYGGMLASWFRIKYPHLAIGALAASAPIWQFPGIYDCEGYFKVVSNDFEQYSQECAQSINASWAAIGRVASSEEGRQWLHDTFQICEPLSDQAAVDNFVDFHFIGLRVTRYD